jgi:cyanophycin synthetase
MKIVSTRVMRGPNYWSNYRQKLIVLKLDLEELENSPTDKIDGFLKRLKKMIPSLYSHECSEQHPGGFFKRVEQGTWLGHVLEHIALEIQTLAGMDCGFGRTRSTDKNGIYSVVFSYEIEQAGLYAAEAAFRIVDALVKDIPYDLQKDIDELKYLKERYAFGPSTAAIIKEAKKRNIPYQRIDNSSLILLGYGKKQKYIRASISANTSNIGVDLAGDKDKTKEILSRACVPVPKGTLIYSAEEIPEAIEKIQFPLVIKPLDGNHGRGITININSAEQAVRAFHIAKKISRQVIVEEYIDGHDFRLLVVNYKLVAVAKRVPAMVMGNGVSSIKELIREVNRDPNRGDGHEKNMTKIKVNEITREILRSKGFELSSILPLGEILFLKDTANISTGGTSIDLTERIHPYNVLMAERVARILNLDICGIDLVAKTIEVPLKNKAGAIVEVNAAPGLRMHLDPSKGIKRNVAEPIIDMLFPNNDNGRIPLIAITGTNGKTTTTRLVAHIAKHAGHSVGYTTTEGIYIDEHCINKGDCTGPKSAQVVLSDPTIDIAVLECARGGILRSGLAFDRCDISIVTNVTEDHLGIGDINTLEEMAAVKSVVARSTSPNGYAILNADDDMVFKMRREVEGSIALFSLKANNKRVLEHCKKGGLAVTVELGYLVIHKGEWKTRIERIKDIPLTMNGRADCMIANILPAALAAFIRGFSVNVIKTGLTSFVPSPETTPGRMNIFNFRDFTVMIDYAHNSDGFLQLEKFMKHVKASKKIALVSGTGDRRDEDIRNIGKLCAAIFDEIIIKHDKDLRGRTRESITQLLQEGISTAGDRITKVISDEKIAFEYALSVAEKGSFITIFPDNVFDAIEYVKEAHSKHNISPVWRASA